MATRYKWLTPKKILVLTIIEKIVFLCTKLLKILHFHIYWSTGWGPSLPSTWRLSPGRSLWTWSIFAPVHHWSGTEPSPHQHCIAATSISLNTIYLLFILGPDWRMKCVCWSFSDQQNASRETHAHYILLSHRWGVDLDDRLPLTETLICRKISIYNQSVS